MMEKIALAAALLGTLALLFLSQALEPKAIMIKEINEKMLEQSVRVRGEVTKIEVKSGLLIIELMQENETIEMIIYKSQTKLIEIGEGSLIEVTGKIISYYGKLQIEAERIRVL